jgi:hypothetical protein
MRGRQEFIRRKLHEPRARLPKDPGMDCGVFLLCGESQTRRQSQAEIRTSLGITGPNTRQYLAPRLNHIHFVGCIPSRTVPCVGYDPINLSCLRAAGWKLRCRTQSMRRHHSDRPRLRQCGGYESLDRTRQRPNRRQFVPRGRSSKPSGALSTCDTRPAAKGKAQALLIRPKIALIPSAVHCPA